MTDKKIKVFIVDDHDMFRQGVKTLLNTTNRIEVVGEAINGKDFLEKFTHHDPDVILMDIAMPEIDGIEATALAREKNPDLKVLALTMFGEEKYYYQMIQQGIKGFVLKSSGISELLKAIETVAEGNNYFSNELLVKLIQNVAITNHSEHPLLTPREQEVLKWIALGYSNEEIAEKLHVSAATIRTHRTNLLHKTGCKNSASLVMWAIKNKIIDLDE
ncbi:MAG: response regulator transcription factor [Bacteroidales bacterium]|nr:response regulator transcription factor [Bacteroidales bacterium]HOK97613.1 response regulator transcription factor [Bacteroidales bacterium]HPO65875.1 response regulator transcription factor [Bacteroidales bacterium]